ncbi:hypothetical protein OQA88_4157 [Cercophora sp. LCS_1]
MPHIIVLGAGITGLTTAITLQSASHPVTILAKDLPGPFETIDPLAQINYTSPWGGAHNRWVPPSPDGTNTREHTFSVLTYRRMRELALTEPACGVTLMKGIEYIEAPGPEYVSLTEERAAELGMAGFRLLSEGEFPDDKIKWGCEYDTWSLNPMVYCCFLLRRFIFRGGRVVRKEVGSVSEVFAVPPDVLGVDGEIGMVVNASGYGFGDDNAMFITRGQTCLVANTCDVTVTRQNADGSWAFCVPRGFEGGTVVGGTKEVGNWEVEPSLVVRERLLQAFKETYPAILGEEGRYKVLADIVGRRPTRRGGPRIEFEVLEEDKLVMHAYGLGGRGYELSWGVAEEVLKGVNARLAAHVS